MVLSLAELAKGKEITHDVVITSWGEEIRIRELPAKELKALHKLFESCGNDEELQKTAVITMLISTITDDDSATLSEERAEQMLENLPQSVITEITTKIFKAQMGKGSGES